MGHTQTMGGGGTMVNPLTGQLVSHTATGQHHGGGQLVSHTATGQLVSHGGHTSHHTHGGSQGLSQTIGPGGFSSSPYSSGGGGPHSSGGGAPESHRGAGNI